VGKVGQKHEEKYAKIIETVPGIRDLESVWFFDLSLLLI